MGSVRIDRLIKEFGGVKAVNDLSLEVKDGELLVLVGPSGCGKTTTLRCVAGLETPTEGHIYLDGKLLTYTDPQERDVAMVFQDYALYPHMTVRENLGFALDAAGLTEPERDIRVEEAAELLDIENLLERDPQTLSGGQKQRVALGRAIVREPEVFLLDEPLANLDPKLRMQMRAELLRIQAELGVTTIYVTHNQTEAMTMGDRIAVMDAGEIQQLGTPMECYHQPSNRFVAEFIGEPSMNFFQTTCRGDSLVAPEFEYSLSPETQNKIGSRTDLVFGIRPEDVEIRRDIPPEDVELDRLDRLNRLDGEGETEHDFPATVDLVEPTGDKTVVYLDVGEKSLVAVVDGATPISHDEEVVVRLPETAIHLFDAETGRAVRNRALETSEERVRT